MNDADPITPGYQVVDAHCHIASEDFIPAAFIAGAIQNISAALLAQGLAVDARRLRELFSMKMQDPLCDELVQEMDQAGIAKSILLIADFSFALGPGSIDIAESFERHRKVLLRHPGRFEVFGGVDPRWGRDGLDLFEKSLLEFGFSGFKVYPPCGFSPSDRLLFPFYELCRFHQIPVLLHTGPTSPVLQFKLSNPFEIDDAAREFPDVNFILAHGGVNFVEEATMMCRFRPNVFLDISGFQGNLGWDPDASLMRTLVSRDLNHKILFGTDWPVFSASRNPSQLSRRARSAECSI